MTLPSERVRAVQSTREFLFSLLDPVKTPKVPKEVREAARRCLKHYPGDLYLNDIFSSYHKRTAQWEKDNLNSD